MQSRRSAMNLNVLKGKKKMPESREKSLFIEFAESTTLHGIRNVFCGDSNLRRFIWFLCVLGSTGCFVWNFAGLLQSYLKDEVVTRVTAVNQDNITFPAVTICNFNPARKSYMQIHLNLSYSDIYAAFEKTADRDDFQKLASNYTETFLINASHKIENMLLQCTLQGTKCLPADFQRVHTNMGVCYTFDHEKRLASFGSIVSTGENFGLTMTLNAELAEYDSSLAQDVGFKVLVHEKNEHPLIEGNGFATMPGVSTFVAVKKHRVKTFPPHCENKKFIGKSLYTIPLCYEQCRRRYVAEECGCYYQTSGASAFGNDHPSCTLERLFGCAVKKAEEFTKLAEKNCSCPRPCERISYDTMLSYGLLSVQHDDDLYSAAMKASQNILDYDQYITSMNMTGYAEEYASHNFVRVKIFYRDLNFHIIEDIPKYDVSSILAAAGGMLGLLLGASVLTLMEFLDFLIRLFRMKWSETKVTTIN